LQSEPALPEYNTPGHQAHIRSQCFLSNTVSKYVTFGENGIMYFQHSERKKGQPTVLHRQQFPEAWNKIKNQSEKLATVKMHES
jgi:hypothetical protein